MLADLKRIHNELLSFVSELETLIENTSPDRSELASVRWKLSRVSTRRLRFIEDKIYPHLLQRVSSADAQKLDELRAENVSLRAAATKHVGTWTIDQAIEDWPGYRGAASALTTAMRRRVAAEKDVLYHLFG